MQIKKRKVVISELIRDFSDILSLDEIRKILAILSNASKKEELIKEFGEAQKSAERKVYEKNVANAEITLHTTIDKARNIYESTCGRIDLECSEEKNLAKQTFVEIENEASKKFAAIVEKARNDFYACKTRGK